MNKQNKYIMNYDTMLFKPEYDSLGNLCTHVIEKNGQIVSNLAPTQLMDFNLRYFGFSLIGAFDGSKMILNKLNKNPSIVQERVDILWFPSKSPLSPESTWFAVHHIDEYQAVDKKRTRVIFLNGSETIVDVSIKEFEYRIQRAYVLKYRREKRSRLLLVQNNKIKILSRMGLGLKQEDT